MLQWCVHLFFQGSDEARRGRVIASKCSNKGHASRRHYIYLGCPILKKISHLFEKIPASLVT